MDKITIIIADDERNIRIGLRALFQSVEDVLLVGEATSGEEVVQLAAELQPDIILMDSAVICSRALLRLRFCAQCAP